MAKTFARSSKKNITALEKQSRNLYTRHPAQDWTTAGFGTSIYNFPRPPPTSYAVQPQTGFSKFPHW